MVRNIIMVYDYAYINGGAANVAISSSVSLTERGYNVFYFSAVGPICDELSESKVNVKCLDIDDINHGSRLKAIINGIWNHEAAVQFGVFLQKFNVEDTVVHYHGWSKALSSAVVHTAQRKGFRSIITLHDYFTLCPNGGFYNYIDKEICTLEPMSAKCILCNCDKRSYPQKIWRVCRQAVQDHIVRNNSRLIYISISQKNESIVKKYVKSDDFFRVENIVRYADKVIPDRSCSNVLLFLGRLSDEKGVEIFCEALSIIKKYRNIHGVVVGSGPLLDEFSAMYRDIEFVGWKDTSGVQEFLNKARCLVFPSKCYEGAPLTVVEAMSACLPCIVSDCTSAIELVIDGENGYSFESNNIMSLVAKVEMIMDDQNLKCIQHNLLRTFDHGRFTPEMHVDKLISVYEDILPR